MGSSLAQAPVSSRRGSQPSRGEEEVRLQSKSISDQVFFGTLPNEIFRREDLNLRVPVMGCDSLFLLITIHFRV